MANLTPEQRQAKYQEANRLARLGYSRRQINTALQKKYGEGIRPAKYTPIYGERVATTIKRLEKQPALRIKPEPQRVESQRRSTLLNPHYSRPARTLRERLYKSLRNAGFRGLEANAFSKYWRKYSPPGGGRKQFPPFLIEMVKDRQAMKEAHMIEARAKGWSAKKSNYEFAGRIVSVYKDLEMKRSRGGLMGRFKERPFVDRIWVMARGNRPGYWRTVPERINPWALKEAVLDDIPDELRWDS